MYPDVQLYIDGAWTDADAGRKLVVMNPATGEPAGKVAHAERADLDRALEAAERGFNIWRKTSAYDRSKVMRKAADLLRSHADTIAPYLTREPGKPLPEAKGEVMAGADVVDWFAEEARRSYGRVIPARAEGIYQLVVKEPVGPVAAFTPWNFPINQVVRKLSIALAAGCSIIVKAPEETPASAAELIRCFADAGVPAGVINLVYGVPAEISEYLIPYPIIKKMSFIGDATQKGATVRTGGSRIGNKGNFFEPSVITDVPRDARVMHEESFGPVAVISRFSGFDEVVTEANRLPYGLASYAYTRSAKTANAIAAAVESGMISINHRGLALPEVPFGGVKDSGYGSEGGLEAIEGYLNTRLVTQAGL